MRFTSNILRLRNDMISLDALDYSTGLFTL